MKIKEIKLALRAWFHSRIAAFKNSRLGVQCENGIRFCNAHAFPLQIMLVILYRLMLDFVYIWQLSPLFAYARFTTDIYLPRYLLTLLLVLVFAPFIAQLQQDERPSSVLISFLNYLYFIPLTSYCGCRGTSARFLLFSMLYWAILLLLQFAVPSVYLATLKVRHSRMLFGLLTIGSIVFVLFVSGYYTHFRLVFDVINVYGVRAEAATYAIPSILRFLLSFMTIILSVLLVYWIRQKRALVVGLLLIVYFFYFSIAAHKSVFLFLFLLLGCYFLYRDWMLRWAGAFLTCGIAACGVFSAAGFIVPLSLFMRRLMYLPVQISDNCCTFFQHHPLNLFRHGIMGRLGFQEIYSINLARLVGEIVNEVTNANNGIMGDLFANLPIPLGLLLMPLILVICFRLLDAVSEGLDARFTVSFCAFFAITFANSAWSTVLLTHGYLVACVLLYLFPRKELSPHEV